MLIADGRDPNRVCAGAGSHEAVHVQPLGMHPLTFDLRSAEMVDVLLSMGAKVERLDGRTLPSCAAFRRINAVAPNETRAVLNS